MGSKGLLECRKPTASVGLRPLDPHQGAAPGPLAVGEELHALRALRFARFSLFWKFLNHIPALTF